MPVSKRERSVVKLSGPPLKLPALANRKRIDAIL
jgi:hypothetical protein